jgi:murein DD-endopeptidase MepM/ murein hydrolase activator NlpD
MKTLVVIVLSFLIPPTFMGLGVSQYKFGDYTNNSANSQTIVVQGDPIPVKKQEWLFDIIWPVEDYQNRTSHFGYRYLANCSQCSTFHQGIDFTPGEGEEIYNIMDGEIVDIGWDGSFGYRAVIRHIIHPEELEYTTIYAHMTPTAASQKFQKGDIVPKGTLIGYVGNTGVSTGPHLHFEVHRNDTVLDPLEFFNKHIVN